MPYPKEYLIYCSIYNKNPSGDNPMVAFNVWLSNKKKKYELEKPKEDFITWLENLKPGTHPLSQLQPKEEDKKEENRKGYLIRQKRKKKERKMLRKANKARKDVGNNGT